MKWSRVIILFVIVMFLAGCASKDPHEKEQGSPSGQYIEGIDIFDEQQEGDFIFRLVTEKGKYQHGETVTLYAELEYVGDEQSITIYHAASPFYFPIVEKTRNYEIEYPMEEPLLSTVLVQGEPYREEYSPRGGFIAEDDPSYIDFMNTFLDKGFPPGEYVVNGVADFFVEDGKEEPITYRLNAQIAFMVYEQNWIE